VRVPRLPHRWARVAGRSIDRRAITRAGWRSSFARDFGCSEGLELPTLLLKRRAERRWQRRRLSELRPMLPLPSPPTMRLCMVSSMKRCRRGPRDRSGQRADRCDWVCSAAPTRPSNRRTNAAKRARDAQCSSQRIRESYQHCGTRARCNSLGCNRYLRVAHAALPDGNSRSTHLR
jgi:hypothetical protein